MTRIYLDHAATSPLLPEVATAMSAALEEWGNPSSLYAEGRTARAAIDTARERIAEAVGCVFGEVVFTSSGTEAANLAILGATLANKSPDRKRVLLSAAEHHCVLKTATLVERLGVRVETVPVDAEARPDLSALEAMLGPDVLLFAGMRANNELGSVSDVAAAGSLCRNTGALHLVDAVQAPPQKGDLESWQADMVVLSAHKLGGPKGVGTLVVRAGTPCQPVTVGGGQERDMRAGTENVAGIVGAAVAVSQAALRDASATSAVRDTFESALDPRFLRSVAGRRTPHHCHVRTPGIDAQVFLIRLDREGVSASSGSACSSGSIEPSHVLRACGCSAEEAKCGLRFTFGHQATVNEAVEAAKRVNHVLGCLLR